jgi:hypothetical protein
MLLAEKSNILTISLILWQHGQKYLAEDLFCTTKIQKKQHRVTWRNKVETY